MHQTDEFYLFIGMLHGLQSSMKKEFGRCGPMKITIPKDLFYRITNEEAPILFNITGDTIEVGFEEDAKAKETL